MLVVTGSEHLPTPRGIAVAIGNFDGVHAGHRHVLAQLLRVAADQGALPAWVYTFDPAPMALLAPDRHQPRILTLTRKLELLDASGMDGVVVEPFTRKFAAQSAEEFADRTLRRRLDARAVVVGWDFRFGAGRNGNVDALREALPERFVEQVTPLLVAGAPVSSSRIRRLIAASDVRGAADLLGRPHRLTGTVMHGDARGRTIGFPTANLRVADDMCLPGHGVYAVRAVVQCASNASPSAHPAVMNIGVRPTFNGTELRIEVHVLDWTGDLYDQQLSVDIIEHIRGEQRFDSVEALGAQITADAARARTVLG